MAVAGGHPLTFNGKAVELTGVLKHVVLGSSVGAGALLAYAVWDLVKAQPAAVIAVMDKWGPMSLIAICGLVLFDRRFGQSVEATRESARAQQALADSVQQLVSKDDIRIREQELKMAVLVNRTEENHAMLTELTQQTAAKSAAAGAS